MSDVILHNRYYTVEDYFALSEEGIRTELENGKLFMSPSPVPNHAKIGRNLIWQLENYLQNKKCELFYETDIELFEGEDTIYCPDIIVVCDPSKIADRCIVGAPDFIIEIGSFGTIKNDLGKKRLAYERAGVKEYWVIRNPYWVHCYLLNEEGKYSESVYRNEVAVKVQSLEGLTIDFSHLQKI
ncbi:MAG: Uma2 family endonuclease [Spirochaetaceae bacterium]|nr:Uma2 family endonuclease [Spirochaetaceae bacterium]